MTKDNTSLDGDLLLLEKTKAEVLVELADDFVGLWELVRGVRRHFGNVDEDKIRTMTLQLVHDLLSERLAYAGHPTSDGRGFVPWQLSAEDTVARISTEWDELGREPNIGEIVWFNRAETAPD